LPATSIDANKPSLKPRSLVRSALRKINDLRCKTWDLRHGVETSGEIPLAAFDFKSDHKEPGLQYHSHHPKILRQILSAVDIEHERYTFVDYGCGKGRVLLVAAESSFRRIIGIEFVPQLAEIARRNLKNYRGLTKCRDMTVITGDATDYELPAEPEILFFYSPFTGTVMEKVVGKVEDSLRRSPRDLFVLFTGVPIMRERAFGSRPHFKRLRRGRYFDVYRYLP